MQENKIMHSIPAGRVEPHSKETEEIVLGTMLLNEEAVVEGIENLDKDDFFINANKEVFGVLVELFNANEPCTIVNATNWLKRANKLDLVGGPVFIAEITNNIIPLFSPIPGYCKTIKHLSMKRQLIKEASLMTHRCFNNEECDNIVDDFSRNFYTITKEKKTKARSVASLAMGVVDSIEKRSKNESGLIGLPTGFYGLDRLTCGLCPSDLIILAGRPSMGKTALGMQIIQGLAGIGNSAQVYSLEMSNSGLVERMISSIGRVSNQRMRTGLLDDNDWQKINRACGVISTLPVTIDDSAGLTITEIRARAKRKAMRDGLDVILVDYLQLIEGRGESRNREITEISAGLKALAKELNVPVIALSQLNRTLEQRPDKRPKMSDLRDSGAIEQDADVIMFIYRDEVYNQSEDNPYKGIAEVIVAKQRNGPIGTVKLGFHGEFTSFRDEA